MYLFSSLCIYLFTFYCKAFVHCHPAVCSHKALLPTKVCWRWRALYFFILAACIHCFYIFFFTHFMGNFLSYSSPPDPAKMSKAKELVDQNIRKNRVMVFSKSYCPYCSKYVFECTLR